MDGSEKLIPLTRGQFAAVDACDYDWLMQFKWCASRHGRGWRAVRSVRVDGIMKSIHMHRVIFGATAGQIVDHINRNPLDNRRSNLRLCTRSENARNSIPRASASSKYMGVHWDGSRKNWRAHIRLNGKTVHLGRYQLEEDAARAYDCAARKHYGEFASPNFELSI